MREAHNTVRFVQADLLSQEFSSMGHFDTVAYAHLQVFSRTKLETPGAWCLHQMQGAGRLWREDFLGGLLLIERCP